MDEGPIIVTGCQRSGTTIASHILGQEKKWVVWTEEDWVPTTEGIYILKSMVKTGRTKLVIQSPTALQAFLDIHHQIPQVHFIGMKRKTEDIIASMKRIKWYQNEMNHYIDYYYDQVKIMNNLWGLLKQILPKDSWTEAKYNDLKEFSQFIPKDQRKNFTSRQWQKDKPLGPKYWTSDPQETEKTS